MPRRGTFSIVARDPQTGALGAAVQSHWFGVGPLVPWARPGVGAVVTQSVADPAYGPRLLDRLAAGEAPRDALDALLAADEQAAYRQVAVVDAQGRVAAHTGERCIAFAGHETGDAFSAQGNLMATPEVWPAMAKAYDRAAGPLPRRLIAALHAAQAAGGDARGQQSAAVLVVPAAGEAWETTVDLRIDDHEHPLRELDRLADLRDAYELAETADALLAEGRFEEAGDHYERASALAPESHELLFWAGLAAGQVGDLPLAVRRVRRAITLHPGWEPLLSRLEPDIAPSAATVREALATLP